MTGPHRRTGLLTTALLLGSIVSAHAEKYALLVGVRDYPEASELRSLQYSEEDVTELAQVLKQSTGFKRENVALLTEARAIDGPRLLPRRENIQYELRQLAANLHPEDLVVVALAGHGLHFKGDSDSYFCPADARIDDKSTLLPFSAIVAELEKCKAGVRLLLVDASRNDSFVNNDNVPSSVDRMRAPGLADPSAIERHEPDATPVAANTGRASGVTALFSCAPTERAYDSPKIRHGVFYHFVIEGLKGKAASPGGDLNLAGLTHYVGQSVEDFVHAEFGLSQRPALRGKEPGTVRLAATTGILAGDWLGQYFYSDGRAPVRFAMRIAQNGNAFSASTREPNTFAENDPKVNPNEPYLYARCVGRFSPGTGGVDWTKTYDGTANVDHAVQYAGTLDRGQTSIDGTWRLQLPGQAPISGRFTLKKQPNNP
jgi:hypothetical protein